MRDQNGRTGRTRYLAAAAGAALLIVAGGAAHAGTARALNIPGGPLGRALLSLATQTGEQLIYPPELVQGRRAAPLSGRYTAEDALAHLLGPDVVVSRAGPKVLVLRIRNGQAAGRGVGVSSSPGVAAPGPARPFAVEADAGPPFPSGPAPAGSRISSADPHTVEEVRVTGSNIRGARPGASSLVVLDERELERLGRATVAEALQALPQNLGGESTEASANVRSDRAGTNAGVGTSVNLRGLGPDATLVLVDGRRMAGSGLRGDFADVSTIPNIALQRVEVLLDGASAIYGSDAVGGVVNLILRRDLDGAEVRARAGAATRGEPQEAQLGVALGRTWDAGGLFLAYEGYRRTALDTADRDFTETSDLRRFGGADRRETTAFPGNVLRTDPVTGGTSPAWGIPSGQNGRTLRPEDFQAGGINLQNQNVGVDLLPDQRRHSAFAAIRQEVGPDLELSGDLRYAAREVRAEGYGATATLTVSRANPWFVSPVGATSHQIQYALRPELGNPVVYAGVRALAGAAGARLRLPGDWAVEGYAALSQQIDQNDFTGAVNSLVLAEALGNTPDNPATAYNPAVHGYFNPFAGQAANDPAVLSAIAVGFSRIRLRNQVATAALQADGPLFALPGGDLRAAVGVQARRETYRRTGSTFNSTVAPLALPRLDFERSVLAAYGELRAPLVGAENRRVGIESLELTAAVRAERYDDFGSTVNPKAGLVWSPLPGLALRGGYSRSFRAPALSELHDPELYSPLRLQQGPVRLLTLALNGGNPELDPETAVAWSAGLDWRPPGLPGLRLSLDGFRIAFKDRVDRPVLLNRAGALTDPRLQPFVTRISPATNPADLALISRLLSDPATTTAQGVFPATEYAAIVDIRQVNTSRLEVDGIDLQLGYATDAAGGRLTLGATAAWMLRYDQQVTPADALVERVGYVGQPPRLRARANADWSRGAWAAGLTLVHQSKLRDLAGSRVAPATTVDARLRFTGPEGSALEDLSATLTVRNLLDRDPSFYDNPVGLGFDPGSGDPVGRFVALQLTRRW
jgi:outer membrane receptor protein involved in Fe transport